MEDFEISCITGLRNIIFFPPSWLFFAGTIWIAMYLKHCVYSSNRNQRKKHLHTRLYHEIADIWLIDNWLQLVKLIESIFPTMLLIIYKGFIKSSLIKIILRLLIFSIRENSTVSTKGLRIFFLYELELGQSQLKQ